jgi:hypothetical protein
MERVVATHRMIAADGTRYDVLDIQEYVDASDKDGASWIPGMKRLELNDGSPVNYIDENTFEILRSGLRIRRV